MFDTQTILFGQDPTEGIVSVEVGGSEATLYIHRNGEVAQERVPFSPWLLVSRKDDIPSGGSATELSGDGYRFAVTFSTWSAFNAARNSLRTKGSDHVAYPSPEKQFLLASGKTLFKGMSFDDVHRMQIDIETAGLSFEPESSRIFLIAVSDNRGFEELIEGDEPEMLAELIAVVRGIDPDTLEGHNILGFDLPFLAARARRCGMALNLGRDGSEMAFGAERSCPIGGYSRPFVPAFVRGRHVIDTLLAVQRFDVGRGRLERYGLKECAQTLGLAEPDRIIIPGDEITGLWATDPETVRIYARQDVRETRRLAELICPAEFYLTQMVPDTYQSAATSGTGEKINSILVREYLRQGRAISKPQPPRGVPGGYTELRRAGLIRNVVKCDVESLYPSLMLSMTIKPASDVLDIFLPALAELTSRRMDAKSKSKSGSEAERAYWDGLQGSFKILINSFYGYLGAPFNFNDYDAAEKVTTSGQAIVKQIAEAIEIKGGSVIEIDTDGVYFESPKGISSEDEEIALVEEIGSGLAEGIRLAHDGRYEAMLSLKIKNYVLVEHGGRKIFRGSSVRSRADEPFGREFISQAVDLLLLKDEQGVSRLYRELMDDIRNGRLPVEKFARRERITSKTFSSPQKKRMAAAAQGVALGDYITVYERANGEIGLIEAYDGDENRDYLLDKLYKFACRLREAFGDEFESLFPKPSGRISSARE
ncbi:MAG: DNA polymerase, partial [Armatimonadetes bacterium]|nr:DNA polymerase [Armatimonadota bacterium]